MNLAEIFANISRETPQKMALVPEKAESAPGIGDQGPGEKKGRTDSVSLSLPV